MKKKPEKKLRLSRETLRALEKATSGLQRDRPAT